VSTLRLEELQVSAEDASLEPEAVTPRRLQVLARPTAATARDKRLLKAKAQARVKESTNNIPLIRRMKNNKGHATSGEVILRLAGAFRLPSVEAQGMCTPFTSNEVHQSMNIRLC